MMLEVGFSVMGVRGLGAGEQRVDPRRTASRPRRAQETTSSRLERTGARRSRRKSELQRKERRVSRLRIQSFGDGASPAASGCRENPAETGDAGARARTQQVVRRSDSVPRLGRPGR
jgi:hypothetical protein